MIASKEATAGFGKNLSHFKSYLETYPKYAIGKYGTTKYRASREQIGVLQDKA